jgi:predicted flap endonuclease-1-like 5' DNA nuclease
MTELLWQSTLLLALAFFFGAVFACGLKRRYWYGPPTKKSAVAVSGVSHAPAPDQPKIEVAPRAAPEGERFGRAISGQSAPSAAAAPAPKPAVASMTAAMSAAAPKPAPAPAAAPAPQPAAPAPAAAPPPPAAAPVAVAPPPAAAPPAPPISSISVSTGTGAPVKPDAGGAGPSDDLTRIRGIDSILQKQLRELGLRRFSDVAALTAADVKGLNDKLGVKGRIEQENWLGQAQILATGGETYYSRRVDRGMPVPEFTEPASLAPAATAAPAPAPKAAEPGTLPRSATARGPSDDLTRIRGIDSAAQGLLNELGIRHFQELATLNAADLKTLGDRLGVAGRIEKENWLGQAQILATGGETYYSRRLGSSAPPTPTPSAAPVAAPAATPAPAAAVAPSVSPAPSADMGYLRSVRSEALVGSDAAHAPRPTGEADDLKRIRGIGVLIEKKLNSLGVTHYEQVANWTGADIERISNLLDFKGRIERENWIEQARILATGGQTEFSRRSEA